MTATATRVTAQQVPENFEKMFTEHSEFVYRTAYKVTGSAEDAEDVLQALFLRLLTQKLPPKVHENLKGYLYRAAVNLSLNVLRRRKRDILTEDADRFESPASLSASDESQMDRRLREALADLRPKAAEILILRYVHGYTDAEIAQLLGTSSGTIAVSAFRARARLKKIFKALGGRLP